MERMSKDDLKGYYEKEIKRASEEIRLTQVKLDDIEISSNSLEEKINIPNLRNAIYVGGLYVKGLEKKFKELSSIAQ